jgi:hypothetical protein
MLHSATLCLPPFCLLLALLATTLNNQKPRQHPRFHTIAPNQQPTHFFLKLVLPPSLLSHYTVPPIPLAATCQQPKTSPTLFFHMITPTQQPTLFFLKPIIPPSLLSYLPTTPPSPTMIPNCYFCLFLAPLNSFNEKQPFVAYEL